MIKSYRKARAIEQKSSIKVNSYFLTGLLYYWIILSLILTFLFVLGSSTCNALNAGKIEIKGLYSIDEDEFLDMFGIREGSLIDREKVSKGIKRTFIKGLFEDISVVVSEGETPTVTITVREKDYIKKIYISGNYEISEKVIKESFLLKEEHIMRYDMLQEAVDDLKEKLSLYGFPDAEIQAEIEDIKEPYRVYLHLKVDTGDPLIINKIKITDPDTNVKNKIKLSEGDIYNQFILREDLIRIKKYYKKKRFFSPVVGPYSYSNREIEIAVEKGRHMTIEINGNDSISTRSLLKEVPFFEIESFNDELVEESVGRMLSVYHQKGYTFAQIAPVIESDEKNIVITFFVFEGEKITVGSIKFKGVSLPQDKLKDVILSREGTIYNSELIDRDRESIKEFYGALGYLEANVKEIKTQINKTINSAELIFDIQEGEKTEIEFLEITGVDPEIETELISILGIKPGDPYNEVDISDARFKVLDYYSNHGYTDVDVLVTRNIENHKASIVFSMIKGKKTIFGKTIIKGNKRTKYVVIKRELLHKEGQPYSHRVLANERQRLYKLGLFTDVEIDDISGEADQRDILVKVKEGNAGSVEFGVGYAEYEEYRGFIELSYRNLWGMNRQGSVSAELSSLEQRYIMQYREPWFLGYNLPFRIFFLYENREEIDIDERDTRYRLRRYSVTSGIEKKLSDKMKAELYHEISLVKTYDVQPDVILSKEDTGTLAISSIKPSIIYDTRDDPFEPKKGILAGISLKVASSLFFSETNFTKLIVNGSAFQQLIRRVTLAISARGGVAYGFKDTEELPLVERFFLGGRSTVRGYEQDMLGPKGEDGNPTGGNAFLMSNIELRTSVSESIGLVTFLDMGNVWIRTKDADVADLKYTVGLGLRYNTPVGPLRVDYGHKLDRENGESHGEVHFSIGHAF